MILEMTKPLKRVRGHRETEEGEVDENSSDEEDGEMKEEQGDDVTIDIKGLLFADSSKETKVEVLYLVESKITLVGIGMFLLYENTLKGLKTCFRRTAYCKIIFLFSH